MPILPVGVILNLSASWSVEVPGNATKAPAAIAQLPLAEVPLVQDMVVLVVPVL